MSRLARLLRRRPNAVVGGVLLALVMAAALVGSVWQPADPNAPDFMARMAAPSAQAAPLRLVPLDVPNALAEATASPAMPTTAPSADRAGAGEARPILNLERLNITLSPDQKQQLLARIVELGDQKKTVTQADLPFLISEVLQSSELKVFEVKDYSVATNRGLRPTATILVRYRDKEIHATGSGNGGYDAFMQALKSIEKQLGFALPRLLDYVADGAREMQIRSVLSNSLGFGGHNCTLAFRRYS